MANTASLEQLAERIERLLLRYAELQRTNELLNQQLQEVSEERDQLQQRLATARSRIDALLERLADPPPIDAAASKAA